MGGVDGWKWIYFKSQIYLNLSLQYLLTKPFIFKNMESSFYEKAIQLITVDQTGKYVLHPDGAAFISKINGPIAVVSVAGLYRTGKSYLLNKMLLNRSNGFGVGPTVNPCTKGLWCWATPIKGTTVDGQKINVIIIDTEGIGALDEDQTHDTRIFTLAILSASSFIYNSVGSIDENALQNLSLVVNLTKSIQISTHNSEEEEDDPEELSSYFPSFYWVVRDFALQLVNSEGEQITSKQYLERALTPQKGFSDDVEEKNRIRRLLSAFFTERQCITLYRPLVDETKLQHLDKLSDEDLRPEFVDQVFNLRKRILGRLKPKMIKGKKLDGPMYLCLLDSYVGAINKGAVPNIQNAWSYMCKEQCLKVFEESERIFDEEINKNMKIPCSEQELISYCQDLKELVCENFETRAIGDQIKKGLKELRNKLNHKIRKIQTENEKEAQMLMKNFFMKSYSNNVAKRLAANEFKTFDEFMLYLSQFYQQLLDRAPNFPRKELTFLEIIKKCIPSAADKFLKNASQQQQKIVKLSADKEQLYQKEIEKLKKDYEQQIAKGQQKVFKLDRQYTSICHDYEELKEQTQRKTHQLLHDHEQLEKSLRIKQEEFNEKQRELSQQLSDLQEQIIQLKNEKNSIKGQWEKQSAVNKFKVQQLSSEVETLKKKQMNLEVLLANVGNEKSNLQKQLTDKYEGLLFKKENHLKTLKESVTQMEETNSALSNELSMIKNDFREKQQNYKDQLAEKNSELNVLKQSYKTEKQKMDKTLTEELQNKSNELETMRSKYATGEKEIKTLQQELKNKELVFRSEVAVLKQTVELMEVEADQKRKEYLQSKTYFQQTIKKMEEEQEESGKENQNMAIYIDQYENKISDMKIEYENQVKKLTSDFESVNKNLTEKELELKLIKTNYSKTQTEYQKRLNDYEQRMKERLNEKEEEFAKMVKDFKGKQKTYIEKIQNLSDQIEQIKEQAQREQREEYEQSEEKVLQLKNFYALEKQRLESRLANEKEKYEKKVQQMEEQCDEKIREEVGRLDEENQQLRMELTNLETSLSDIVSSLEHEKEIKAKGLENQQRINEELKHKIQSQEAESRKTIEKYRIESATQKQVLNKKIQDLQNGARALEKQATKATSQKEQIQKVIQEKMKQITTVTEELTSVRNKFQKLKQEHKNQVHDLKSKIQSEKMESEKRIAVLEEQKKHGDQRLDDYEKSSQSLQQQTEEKIKKIREEYISELRQQQRKNQEVVQNLQVKLENAKKSAKQNENSLQRTVNNLEKDLIIANEKLTNFKEKLNLSENKLSSESETLNEQIVSLKSNFKKQKNLLNQTIQKQKKDRQAIQAQKTRLNAEYQQEKLLWENKYKFLEETHRKYKQEYEENRTKLQAALENDRKKRTTEKMAGDNSHAEQMRKLEKAHQTKIQQIYETNNRKERQLQNNIKNLQFENRELSEKLALENQNSLNNHSSWERRIKDLENNEKRLMSELDKVKTIRETEHNELMTTFEKEKDSLKQKLSQKEQKSKAIEKQKQLMFYENSKQKAKWDAEKEQMGMKVSDLNEKLQKSEKECEKMRKQVERLKIEKKCSKSSMNSGTRLGNLSTIDYKFNISKSSFEDNTLKQNNTSQMSDTSFFFKND